MANSVVQTIRDAEIDARSLSEFIYNPADAMVSRRLAPSIHTLNYYLRFFDNATASATADAREIKEQLLSAQQQAQGTVSYIENTIRDAIDTTVIENSPVSDALVSVDGSLSQRTINKGLESIADLSAINNPKNGLRVYVKSYHAGLGEGGGYFTFDSSKTDVNDGGLIINGWVKDDAALVSVKDFGAIGDGAKHPLSEKFSSLEEAQAFYPSATSLEESIDGAALQTFFDAFKVENSKVSGMATGTFYISKPIVCSPVRQSTFYGTMKLITDEAISHMINFESASLQWRGIVQVQGRVSLSQAVNPDWCIVPTGVILGRVDGKTPNSFHMSIDAIEATGFSFSGVQVLNWAMFLNLGHVRTLNCGSTRNAATWSDRTDDSSFSLGSKTTIKVSSLPPDVAIGAELNRAGAYAVIDGYPYTIKHVDKEAMTISVQTKIDTTLTDGTLHYAYGGGVLIVGANTSGWTIDEIQASACGIGFNMSGLYGGFIGHLSMEACVIGRKFGEGKFDTTTIGATIASSYYEGNKIDTVVTTRARNAFNDLQSTNLYLSKVFNTNSYRKPNNSLSNTYAQISDSANIHKGKFLSPIKLGGNEIVNGQLSVDVTNPHHAVMSVARHGLQVMLVAPDLDINRLYGYDSSLIYHRGVASNASPTATVVTPPAGYTVNKSSTSITLVKPLSNTTGTNNGVFLSIILDVPNKNFIVDYINHSQENEFPVTPPVLEAGASQVIATVNIDGVTVGQHLSVTYDKVLSGSFLWANIVSKGVVDIHHYNPSTTPVTLASGNVRVKQL